MSENIFDGKENLSQNGKETIQRETRERLRPIVKELAEKFTKLGFRKVDFVPAIKKGIEEAKGDV